ncbi:hypothetical protein [Marinicellulosiphila megalodicopiae]|uniref:hypothetical protein n=1 Tax=Marinicellulosiphila megalodicopiae TaxID=2724896 RepID=UPI003BAEBE82
MRPFLKVLGIIAVSLMSLPTFADNFRPTLQINYGKYISYGTINYEHNPTGDLVSEEFILEGQSLDIKYVYSAWTAISAEYHQFEDCRIENAKTKLGCHFDSKVEGASLEFLTGVNLDGQGLFFYSGIGIAMEMIDGVSSQDDIYTPFGVGLNVGKFVIELSTEIRSFVDNGYDAHTYGVFSELDSDYTLLGEPGSFAKTQPITASVGVRF